ncbi:O-methylsterigmatocystin oxidoreductase [Sparassis crispa]|uniref:O-methylsterigmatocystin oxidoreductase n=1 Tax=Sparassis crispa TaxID=139825 RepID=A0A401H4U0_9APHY|nr:O-methylsterigmatocystin oxidoreductase [Sparassis crispa]GBE89466.1 O-methylsterigmatocystin oxidoreductase [Sparassis crispa]
MSSLIVYLCIACIVSVWLYSRHKKSPPLPPGPPAEPFIGHMRIFPTVHQADVFHKWAAEYGNVFYLTVLGQSMVVLNDFQSATDLLEKRSGIYSDRADCTTYDLMGLAKATSLRRYGTQWRRHRRMLQEPFLAKSCVSYQELQLREVRIMLKNMLSSPANSGSAIERFAAGITMDLAYGHRVLDDDDKYVMIAKEATHAVEAGGAGTSPLDLYPFLQHIPRWLPGCSSFTAVVRKWRPAVLRMYDVPFEAVLAEMATGTARRSYTSSYLERYSMAGTCTGEDLQYVKETAATIFIGGFDTTWSTLLVFVYAMLLFPDAQRKARDEIDGVVGSDRLPDFSDRADLPYVECVLQEVLRWHTILPLGLPHRSIKDDIYDGMYIPKGSLVIPNVMAMSRDEKVYHDPDKFCPERFLPKPDGYAEPYFKATFGFGRRICLGRHLAESTTWIAIANILAMYEITNAVGEDGEKIVPEIAFTENTTSQPEPFEWVMVPRSEKAKALLLSQTNCFDP